MNIFKIIASSKKGFPEEYASAILAWLLNPTMDHGLGFLFLRRIIDSISRVSGTEKNLDDLQNQLSDKLRIDQDSRLDWSCYLEYSLQPYFRDVLFKIENWVFAIENKIRPESASPIQLAEYYNRLKSDDYFSDCNIVILFIVPTTIHPAIIAEFENPNIRLENDDRKVMMTWTKESNFPSVSQIIDDILQDESISFIDPISEYTRQTLKAFNNFISNGFNGYDYDYTGSTSGVNALTEKMIDIKELEEKEGYIGVQWGIAGLLRMNLE